MSQSKKKSAIETTVNTVVGLIVSFCIQLIMYPLMGIEVTVSQNLFILFIFISASWIRSYFIRRLFNSKISFDVSKVKMLSEYNYVQKRLIIFTFSLWIILFLWSLAKLILTIKNL